MVSRPGRRPVLSHKQIRLILAWDGRRTRFRAIYGSVADLSRCLSLPLRLVYKYLDAWEEGRAEAMNAGSLGRPRRCSEVQYRRIIRWARNRRRMLGRYTTVAALAVSLNVKPDRVFDCIRREGLYPALNKGTEPRKPGSTKRSYSRRPHHRGPRTSPMSVRTDTEGKPS